MQSDITMMMRIIINGTVESCMAIYLAIENGVCFEERIWWVYGIGESCVAQERLAMVEG